MTRQNLIEGVLRKARVLLVKHGWIQGRAGNKNIGFCMVGAVDAATKSSSLRTDAVNAITRCIGQPSIVGWNDRGDRSKREVLSAFTRAANSFRKMKR